MKFVQATITQLFRPCLLLACSLLTAHTLYSQSIYSQPYTFTTLAGNACYGSAEGIGSNARFYQSSEVAADSAGNIYVADTWNHSIRKITPVGTNWLVSTLAGLAGCSGSADGVGANARFNKPTGLVVDGGGNIYVADAQNNTIRKITPAGAVSTLAGLAGSSGSADGVGSEARFSVPGGVALDSTGTLYVADGNHTIRKITPAGLVTTWAGLAGSSGSADGTGSNARFANPSGVAVDGGNNIYVADSWNHAIRKITPAGAVSTLAGLAGSSGSANGTGSNARFNYPFGVAVDGGNNIYVADSWNHAIRKITPAGAVSTLAGLTGSSGSANGTGSTARFNYPCGVAVGATEVYVADTQNNTIRKITLAGTVSTLAGLAGSSGSADGVGSNARFRSPSGLALDSTTNLYVADTQNNTIRKITPGGAVSTLAGRAGSYGSADGAGSNARFFNPLGLAVDSVGIVYVADSDNHTIRMITPAETNWVVGTLAGLAGSSGSADGAGANARFNKPCGVTTDGAGNLYVADSWNHAIRKITPAGVVSTWAGRVGVSGSVDGTGSNAQFYCPNGVTVDSGGTAYVADTANHTIRKITPAGLVTTLAGLAGFAGSADGTGSSARLRYPTCIAVDRAGNIYVADSENHVIRKITPAGAVSTLAGLAEASGSYDGAGSNARFYHPASVVVVDGGNNIYVVDKYNNTVRLGFPPPFLSFSRSAERLILSWPLEASSFVLETSSTFVGASSWVPVTNAVTRVGNSCFVTNGVESGARFFRLRLP